MRAAAVGGALLAAVLFAGCTGAPRPAPAGEALPAVPEALRVTDPLDVRGIPPCELLTSAQLREVGLDPATAQSFQRAPGGGCSWEWLDGSNSGYVGANGDPGGLKLDSYYRNADLYYNFTAFRISGYPALRTDGLPSGSCLLQVGAADDHVLEIQGYIARRDEPEPCAMAIRMAEMVLSNLPPLR